jgi:hypothetical protein
LPPLHGGGADADEHAAAKEVFAGEGRPVVRGHELERRFVDVAFRTGFLDFGLLGDDGADFGVGGQAAVFAGQDQLQAGGQVVRVRGQRIAVGVEDHLVVVGAIGGLGDGAEGVTVNHGIGGAGFLGVGHGGEGHEEGRQGRRPEFVTCSHHVLCPSDDGFGGAAGMPISKQ